MKRIFAILVAVLLSATSWAQSPDNFSYQAVLRDAEGNIQADQDVSIDISILQGSVTGTEVFTETHTDTTNAFGLINLVIGSENPTDFASIDWSAGPYFIKVVVDGTEMGISQLLSVPFALHAKTAETTTNYSETDPV